jgi:iodotyrosine deiodinase
MEENYSFIPYHHVRYSDQETIKRSEEHYRYLNTRRTVRNFSPDPVPMEAIDHIILSASTAPSGANKQPWIFCVVTNKEIKAQIRVAAEEEEYLSYHGR